MTQINSHTTSVGRFTDIRDVLFEIVGTENIWQDMAKIVSIADSTHKWNYKVYSTGTSNTNQAIEGADLTGEAPPTTYEADNVSEINKVVYDITDRLQAIAKKGKIAGVKNKLKEGVRDAMLELKAKCERSYINGAKSTGDATHIFKTQGIVPMALSLGVTSYSSDTAFGTTFEATFRTFLQNVRTAGGLRTKNKAMLMSYVTKEAFAMGVKGKATDFTSPVGSGSMSVNTDVTIYKCQFGDLTLMGHDVMVDGKLIVFEKEFAKIGVLEATHPVAIARTGLAEKLAFANDTAQIYEKPSTLGHMIIS